MYRLQAAKQGKLIDEAEAMDGTRDSDWGLAARHGVSEPPMLTTSASDPGPSARIGSAPVGVRPMPRAVSSCTEMLTFFA